MTRHNKLLTGFTAVLVLLLVAMTFFGRSSAVWGGRDPRPQGADTGDCCGDALEEIHSQLSQVVELLSRDSSRSRSVDDSALVHSVESSGRDAVYPHPDLQDSTIRRDLNAVLRALPELQNQVRDLQSESPYPTSAQLRAASPTPNWLELESLRNAWIDDWQAATRSVRLMSDDEILSRFGAPTEIEGGMWTYKGVSPSGAKIFLIFYMVSGRVIKLNTGH